MTDRFSHYSLFGEAWWLNAVCGNGGWDEVRIESGGRLDARLPYVLHRRKGITTIGMPPFTQKLGPWFASSGGRESANLARQKSLTEKILQGMPRHTVFRQNFHGEVTNWLPWYWRGYQQTTRYSYVLNRVEDTQSIWTGLQGKIRGDIRKARTRFELDVRHDLSVDVLMQLYAKTFERQRRSPPHYHLIEKVIDAALSRGSGRMFFAVDGKKRVHAAAFTVWDERSAYYLIGGADPELRNSGAQSLILWEAIQHAMTVSQAFDFEGSMIESIEHYFRGFGAQQAPYSQVVGWSGRLPAVASHILAGVRAMFEGTHGSKR